MIQHPDRTAIAERLTSEIIRSVQREYEGSSRDRGAVLFAFADAIGRVALLLNIETTAIVKLIDENIASSANNDIKIKQGKTVGRRPFMVDEIWRGKWVGGDAVDADDASAARFAMLELE